MNGCQCNVEFFDPGLTSYSGTADAVYRNINHIHNHDGDLVVILAGDHIYKMDYRDMIAFHRSSGADVTVGVNPVPLEEAHRFGIVTVNKEGMITNFVEKPRIPLSNLVSMGIYIFNKQTLLNQLIEDAENVDSPHDFGHAVIPEMVRRGNVFAYEFKDYWRDIGNPQAYYLTHMELLESGKIIHKDDEWPIFTVGYNLILPSTNDNRSGNIVNSLVSPGCVVKGRIKNSILSPGVRIDEGSEIRDSILMDNTRIGDNSVVDRSILDEKVTVGPFAYLGSDKETTSGNNPEITLLGYNVVVPSHITIQQNCKIPPNTREGDFKEMVISPNNVPVPELYAGVTGN
jgi:glucose-1-phosphate adenylyltransferase